MIALVFLGTLAVAAAQDVSVVLANYPQFSKFNELLKTTGVLAEVNMRNSMSILLPEDGILNGFVGSNPSYTTQMLADVIRYHCLLQYFGGEELANITPENGAEVTTLYQTTGRANDLDGFVNITALPDGTRAVGPSTPGTPPQANILTNVTQYPYNYSFLQISAVLQPLGLAAAQLAPTTPPTVSPVPAPAPIDAPVVAPVMAPVGEPVMAPVEAPVMAPVGEPVMAPVKAPVMGPVKAPVMAPVKAPVAAPSVPVMDGPIASAPMMPVSGVQSVRFHVAALMASVFVAALLL
jgi:hypothetical protein